MTPHPEPRIMTTAEPTLEQIAAGSPESPFFCAVNQSILARELLALRDRIERCDEWSVQHGQMIDGQDKRLDVLERVQRDAETGERDETPDSGYWYRRWVYANEDFKRVQAQRDSLSECSAAQARGYLALKAERDRLAAALASATPAEGGEG